MGLVHREKKGGFGVQRDKAILGLKTAALTVRGEPTKMIVLLKPHWMTSRMLSRDRIL